MKPGAGTSTADPAWERLTPHVWRVAVPVHTLPPFDHTNAYLIVDDGAAILVDPGSGEDDALALLDAALAAAGADRLELIALTHTHPDHIDGVAALLPRMSTPAVGVHPLEAGLLPSSWPLRHLSDGETLRIGRVALRCLLTPGHSPGHLAYLATSSGEPAVALAGDLVAAEGSVWVGLPDGDMAAYLRSLELLAASGAEVLGAGHGPAIRDVKGRLAQMAEHRLEREAQVLAALEGSDLTARQITEKVYPPLPRPVIELALKSVEAHLVKLLAEGLVARTGRADRARYRRS